MNSEYFLSSVDPGGDTGLSLLRIGPQDFELLGHATVLYMPRVSPPPTQTLIGWRLGYPGTHRLLYEDFHLRNTDDAAGTDTTALKVIGGIDQMLFDRNGYEQVIAQEPVQGKHLVTDEVLERLGLHFAHKNDMRHVRDSLRHSVAYLTKRGYLPVCRRAFPRGSVPTNR